MRIGQKLGDTCLCIFKMVAATILNFIESLILGHDNPLMANLRNLTQIPLSKTDIWSKNNIQDSCCRHFEFPTITVLGLGLVWPIWNSTPNLVQISQELAEIHLLVYFQDGGGLPSWSCYSAVTDHSLSPWRVVHETVIYWGAWYTCMICSLVIISRRLYWNLVNGTGVLYHSDRLYM